MAKTTSRHAPFTRPNAQGAGLFDYPAMYNTNMEKLQSSRPGTAMYVCIYVHLYETTKFGIVVLFRRC